SLRESGLQLAAVAAQFALGSNKELCAVQAPRLALSCPKYNLYRITPSRFANSTNFGPIEFNGILMKFNEEIAPPRRCSKPHPKGKTGKPALTKSGELRAARTRFFNKTNRLF